MTRPPMTERPTTRQRRIALMVGVTVLFLIVLFPLSVALPLAIPRESGLSARQATGTIWSGVLRDAQLAGMPLGDTKVGLLPLPLLTGAARLQFAGPVLRGTLVAASKGFGIAHASGAIDIASRVKPLPISQLMLDDTAVYFERNRCIQAEGRVRASVSGDLGGVSLPGGLTGVLKCEAGRLVVPLVSQSGMERVDLRIAGDGKWQGEIAIRTTDPAVVDKLVAAGFTPGPRGFAIQLTGAL